MTVVLSFKRQFVAPIRAGTKAQTIRANRKRNPVVSDALHLYFGMRTKHRQLIGRAECESVTPIVINARASVLYLTGSPVSAWENLNAFAEKDGFPHWNAMREFWIGNHGLKPFEGIMIRWRDFVPNDEWVEDAPRSGE